MNFWELQSGRNGPSKCHALILIFSALLGLCCAGITFSNPKLSVSYAPVLRFRGGIWQFSPVSARLVVENDTSAAQNDLSRRPMYSGAVVLAKGYPWRTFFPWMHQVAIPGGALAVALYEAKVDDAIGWTEFLTAPFNTSFSIPVIAISRQSFIQIEQALASLNATERAEIIATVDDSGGITPWRQILTSPLWWIVSIFTAASSCAMACFAFIRFRDFYLVLGLIKWGVPQTILVLQFVSSMIRFTYWSLDPMFARSLIPQVMHTPWRTWSFPFTIASMLVLVFYWFESVNGTSLKFSWNIQRYRWPCYILICLAYALAVAASICYYTGADAYAAWLIDYVEPGYYLLIGLGLGLFYVITAVKILLTMGSMQIRDNYSSGAVSSASEKSPSGPKSDERRRRKAGSRIRSISFKLVAMGATYLSIVFIGFYTLNKDFLNWVPNHNVYTWAIMAIMLNANAFFTMLALAPPRAKSGRPTGSSTESIKASKAASLV